MAWWSARGCVTRPNRGIACPARPRTRAVCRAPIPIRLAQAATSRRTGRRSIPAASTRASACAVSASACRLCHPSRVDYVPRIRLRDRPVRGQYLRQIRHYRDQQRLEFIQSGPNRGGRALLLQRRPHAAACGPRLPFPLLSRRRKGRSPSLARARTAKAVRVTPDGRNAPPPCPQRLPLRCARNR